MIWWAPFPIVPEQCQCSLTAKTRLDLSSHGSLSSLCINVNHEVLHQLQHHHSYINSHRLDRIPVSVINLQHDVPYRLHNFLSTLRARCSSSYISSCIEHNLDRQCSYLMDDRGMGAHLNLPLVYFRCPQPRDSSCYVATSSRSWRTCFSPYRLHNLATFLYLEYGKLTPSIRSRWFFQPTLTV